MSYTYLQGQEVESSEDIYSVIDACVLSKSKSTPEKSLSKDSLTESCQNSQSGTTSQPLMESPGKEWWTLFVEDSPAKICPRQAVCEELGKVLEAVYSGKCYALQVKPTDPSSSLRMSIGFSLALRRKKANGSTTFSGPWPKSGMMRSGSVYPLPALVRHTYEKDFGLLPTPTKHNSKEGAYPAEYTRNTPTLATHAGGKINPEWSEHLMGFPHKWTDLGV